MQCAGWMGRSWVWKLEEQLRVFCNSLEKSYGELEWNSEGCGAKWDGFKKYLQGRMN